MKALKISNLFLIIAVWCSTLFLFQATAATLPAPPETIIIDSPQSPVKTSDYTFQFSGESSIPKEQLQYSWRLDDGEWSAYSSQTMVTLKNLSDGFHLFEVKAIDSDGNEDSTPATARFRVEIQLPETAIIDAPRVLTETNSVTTIRFTGSDLQTSSDQLRYSWRLDNREWSEPSQETSVSLRNLLDGSHLFEVKAIDADGNEDPTPAATWFMVDSALRLPETLILNAPESPIKTSDFTFQFNGRSSIIPEDQLRYSWRLDNGKWSVPSPETLVTLRNLSNGLHLFEVRAIDADGNEDPTPARVMFEVEIALRLPDTLILNAPKGLVETSDYTFQFSGKSSIIPKEQLRYSWRLDSGEWSVPSPKTVVFLANLSDGWHVFEVKAIDVDGNEDPTPARVMFMVEIGMQLPRTEIIDAPMGTIKTGNVTIRFAGIDLQTPADQLRYSWRLDSGEWSVPSRETLATLKNLSDGFHLFEVRAIDADYNQDPTPSAISFVVLVPFYNQLYFRLMIAILSASILFYLVISVVRYTKRSKEFQEEFNPYQAGEPIITPENFYGRKVEIGKIKSMLQSGSVIVHGERRIGKTSILRQIERTIDGKFIPCFVQLGGATQATFFRIIGKGIATCCNKVGIPTYDLLVETQHEGYDGLDLREDIKRIVDRMREADQDEKLLVIIDEVDVTNYFPSYIQESIRAIAQDFTQSLKFIVAGTYIKEAEDDALSRDRPSAWYNAFRHLEIEPLNEKEARELIEKPVGKAYRYSSKAVDYILAQSLKRPYVIQLICYHIIERMKTRHKTRIELEDAEIAFAEVVNEFDTRLKYLWWVRLPEEIQKAFKTEGYLEYTGDNDYFIELLEKEGIVRHDGLNIQPSPIFAEWIGRNQK